MKIIVKGPLADLLWGMQTPDAGAAIGDALPASGEDADPALVELVGCNDSDNV